MDHRPECPELVGNIRMCTCLVRADYERRLGFVADGGCAEWLLGPHGRDLCVSDVCCDRPRDPTPGGEPTDA